MEAVSNYRLRFLQKSQEHDTRFLAGIDCLFVPNRGLNLTYVRLAQHKHRHSGLAYASANGERQLAV